MDAKILGELLGAAAGSAIAPGIGTSIGASLGGKIGGSMGSANGASGAGAKQKAGAGIGLLQLLQGAQKKKDANAAFPQLYDPQQMAFLDELSQKRKALETGAEFASGMNAIDASTAGTNESILRGAGGDVSGTIGGLLAAQRVGQDQKNQLLSNAQGYGLQYNNMYHSLLDKISGRAMQLKLAKSEQARAEWAQKSKDGTSNLFAGSSYLGGGNGGSGMGFDPMSMLSGMNLGGGGGNSSRTGVGGNATAGGSMGGGLPADILGSAPSPTM